VQNRALVKFFSPQFGHTAGSGLVAFLISYFAVVKAFSISLLATAKALFSSSPITAKASFQSPLGNTTFAALPMLVLAPHFEQKYAFSESCSPHLGQNVMFFTNNILTKASFKSCDKLAREELMLYR